MNAKASICVFVCILPSAACLLRAERPRTITVAPDSSGDYHTIQQALDAVPLQNTTPVVILLRKGFYNEKLFIRSSHVTLVGEDRDSTRIVYAELREQWNRSHSGSDWGAAVVNIDSLTTDVTIASLTIYNNYGALHGTTKHQFAIRGGGTRVIVLDCNLIADGGDTVSPWNRENGMYYFANCSFEGWVDYVCPRGWCYITDSRFFGHNLSASIWHDGSADKDQKFVIRYSLFDGVPGFPLARHHRDAQFYLLDCIFTRNMADRPIYLPQSPNAEVWKWGARHYFYNCHREGGDFAWFTDNLQEAGGAPTPDQITAAWTFGGRWDPDATMPAVLPRVAFPVPRDGAYNVRRDSVVIAWVPSRTADSHCVHFGETGDLPLRATLRGNSWSPGALKHATTYYWRVDEVAAVDTIRGPVWHFTTR